MTQDRTERLLGSNSTARHTRQQVTAPFVVRAPKVVSFQYDDPKSLKRPKVTAVLAEIGGCKGRQRQEEVGPTRSSRRAAKK